MEKFDVSTIFYLMMDYQRINNIEGKCIDNVQYYYDNLICNGYNNVKVKPIFVIGNNDIGDVIFFKGHLVIMIGESNSLLDPSYEVFNLKNVKYYDNIKDVIKVLDDIKIKVDTKQVIETFYEFYEISEIINSKNNFISTGSGDYYLSQANYIENYLDKIII